jgi:uncharacterized membrane protein
MESRKRTIIRSLTYRALATAVLSVISLVFTSSVSQTTLITIIFTFFATLGYYGHERIWGKIKWEIKTDSPYQNKFL